MIQYAAPLAMIFLLAISGVISMAASDDQTKKTPPAKAKGKEIAVVETNLGTFEIEFYRDDAPKTVENFVQLAKRKFFDGVKVHRVAKGFVIQAGDPTGTGSGGTSIYGGEFADELNPATASYKRGYVRGVVAMANRGPNTQTSQFFVMLADAPQMPKNYTIFGMVVKGMEVVDKIGAVDIVPAMGPRDGAPRVDVIMKTVTIRTEPPAEPKR